MNNPRLATRYAKSIIDLSIEKGLIDKVYADMKLILRICKTNPDFVALLRSPIISATSKGKIIEAITLQRVSELTSGFIKLLVIKSRESNLPEIAAAYIDQYNVINNIQKVKITTAAPMSNQLVDAILNKVKESDPTVKLELETIINEELIGGFVLEAGGRALDASIQRELKDVKKQFANNDYLHKLR